MAQIESVAIRQRGGYDFATHYDNLCALHNTCPIDAVKANLTQNILDINADRIRASDWPPILSTIKINKTLESIVIRSFYQQYADEQVPRFGIANGKLKMPAIRSKEITWRLSRALKDCLAVNQALKSVVLEAVPLRERDAAAIAKGISKSSGLKSLSFAYSAVGDEFVEIVCRVIKNKMSVTSLDFTGCSLSSKAAETLADVIKHQAMLRHTEAWQDSLRYRKPDLDRMPGLRRITVNSNQHLGDDGAQALATVLKDDLWVKAVDLQRCGLTNVGGKALLEILKYNTTLVVMDVRENPAIDAEVLRSVMDQVLINCSGHETEYKWIKIEAAAVNPGKQKPRRKRNKPLQNTYAKKMSVKISSSGGGSSAKKRSRTAMDDNVRPGPGMPWRTALRAARYRGGYPMDHTPGTRSTEFESASYLSSPMSSPSGQNQEPADGNCAPDEYDRHRPLLDGNDREIRSELDALQRTVAREAATRNAAEKRVLQLLLENNKLKEEVAELKSRRSILDDDRVLDSIEQSFQQFHAFMDMLRDAGLGQLITMAGLDQSDMPFPKGSPVTLANGRSRLDTTMQMRSFLEQSRHDAPDASFLSERSVLADPKPVARARTSYNPDGPPSRNFHSVSETNLDVAGDRPGRSGSKFDELYWKALRETDELVEKDARYHEKSERLSDGGVPRVGGVDTTAAVWVASNRNGGSADVRPNTAVPTTTNNSHSDRSYRSDTQSEKSRSSAASKAASMSTAVPKMGSVTSDPNVKPASDSDRSMIASRKSHGSRKSPPLEPYTTQQSHDDLPRSVGSSPSKSVDSNAGGRKSAADEKKTSEHPEANDRSDDSVEEIFDFEEKV